MTTPHAIPPRGEPTTRTLWIVFHLGNFLLVSHVLLLWYGTGCLSPFVDFRDHEPNLEGLRRANGLKEAGLGLSRSITPICNE